MQIQEIKETTEKNIWNVISQFKIHGGLESVLDYLIVGKMIQEGEDTRYWVSSFQGVEIVLEYNRSRFGYRQEFDLDRIFGYGKKVEHGVNTFPTFDENGEEICRFSNTLVVEENVSPPKVTKIGGSDFAALLLYGGAAEKISALAQVRTFPVGGWDNSVDDFPVVGWI